MSEAIEEIKGFQVVPLLLQPSKFLKNQSIKHYIYVKKHQSNTDKELAERSLFLINPPINSTLSNIKNFFKKISQSSIIENFFLNVENLDYEINLTKLTTDLYDQDEKNLQEGIKLPNGTGLVVFVDKAAANLAFSKIKKYVKNSHEDLYQWNFNEDQPASIRFTKAYQNDILPAEQTSEAVAQALEDFEKREADSISQLEEMKTLVDEDGFTMVVGKNRKTKKGILGKIDSVNKVVKDKNEVKSKKKEKEDFYRFQIRERKKLEMNELVKKFRQDQERIKELKEKKRFRPY